VAVVTAGALLALAAPAAAHVENPGSFTFNESGAVLRVGLFQIPLPAGSTAGQSTRTGTSRSLTARSPSPISPSART